MRHRVWVLGAPDPEMEMIERMLRDADESVIYATTADGRRAAEAYRCPIPDVPPGATVYAVECIDVLPEGWVRIDHHRPGDPGYGRPPAEFLAASSIGQVIAELARLGRLRARWSRDEGSLQRPRLSPGELYCCSVRSPGSNGSPDHDAYLAGPWRRVWMVGAGYWSNGIRGGDTALHVPRDLVLTAAADHCLGAAYRSECPGVDPDALMRWRVESRAAFQGRSADEILADVERAREALRAAPRVQLADGIDARDMRDAYTVRTTLVAPYTDGANVDAAGVGDSTTITFGPRAEGTWDEGGHHTVVQHGVAELPEAAAREGVCFVARLPGPDGRTKIVCQAGSPEQIRAFMTAWAPAQGLVDIYGDPARGFAGGYLAT